MAGAKLRQKRACLLSEIKKEPVTMAMFPQYDLTKDVRFELMKKVFGSEHLHKRHTFLTKDTERECRAHDRQKKLVQIEYDREKQKVQQHFLKLLNNTNIPIDDLRYSYNNWPHNFHNRPSNKQEELEKASLECTVTYRDGKEMYFPAKNRNEILPKLKQKATKPEIVHSKGTKFPLYKEFTM